MNFIRTIGDPENPLPSIGKRKDGVLAHAHTTMGLKEEIHVVLLDNFLCVHKAWGTSQHLQEIGNTINEFKASIFFLKHKKKWVH